MNKEEFRKFHGVDFLNFQKYLESIGFKRFGLYVYTYNEYTINIQADSNPNTTSAAATTSSDINTVMFDLKNFENEYLMILEHFLFFAKMGMHAFSGQNTQQPIQ